MNGPEPGPFIGMIKPHKRGQQSYEELLRMLPADFRTVVRHAPIKQGTMEEFANAVGAYESLALELAKEGVDLLHPEGTPTFLIMGYAEERRTVERWEARFGVPVFTSAMCQVNALRAAGVNKMVDAGYDPTTGPAAEGYFRDAGFDVLRVEKVAVDWAWDGQLSIDDATAMLSALVERYPEAEGLCLQGSSKWPLGAVPVLEERLGIPVIHPIAARYRELMVRTGRFQPQKGKGRLLATM